MSVRARDQESLFSVERNEKENSEAKEDKNSRGTPRIVRFIRAHIYLFD